jgi:protein-L-isoaspartate(D-aspartate) O-methyltransferase
VADPGPAPGGAAAAAPAAQLRAALVTHLERIGGIRSAPVRAAFLAVPRHLFTPGEPLHRAYANDIVVTRTDSAGMPTSSVSAPGMQAVMLEQAQVRPGMRVLEIGSGGYNAALLAELAGPAGQVVTADIDPQVTARARDCLARAGYPQVTVVLADGEYGVPGHAPYDRIIVTAGAWDIPPAWPAQLAAGGRLVVPLRIRGLTRSAAFEPRDGHLASLSHLWCAFVPVQGAGARAEQRLLLDRSGVAVRTDDDVPGDAAVLGRALAGPAVAEWSGVRTRGGGLDSLFLWLAGTLPRFGLLTRPGTEAARALAEPASPYGGPALLGADGGSFAYLTARPAGAGGQVRELGARGHGPDGAALAGVLAGGVRRWDAGPRRGPAAQIAVYPAGTPAAALPPGGQVIAKRHTLVVLCWPRAPATAPS